jgi:hypothetical protein
MIAAEGRRSMTEAEWLASTDPQTMLKYLREASDRKLRLFACACCHRIWHLLTDDDRHAVGAAEQFAEGLVTAKVRDAARYTCGAATTGHLPAASRAAGSATFASGWATAGMTAAHAAEAGLGSQAQCDLIGELFGNPFRLVSVDPAWGLWNSGTIPKLAQAIYEERTFDRMPLLADALEDAGCTDPTILDHLRGPGRHVRGCWVIDLLRPDYR